MKQTTWLLVLPSVALAISAPVVNAEPDVAQPQITGSEVVASIPVVPEHVGGYVRSEFGTAWYDLDHNGCDTREDVLKAESTTPVSVGSGCTILSGTWFSPYDGAVWTNKADVDIDHMVPLKEVWDSGGWAWTAAQRLAYANDLSDSRTLIAVTDNVNQSKSDQDPAQWMPPKVSYWCTYASQWVAIKARWGLSMDSAEANFLRSLFSGQCAGTDVEKWSPAPAGVASISTITTTTTTTIKATPVTTSPVRGAPTTTVKAAASAKPGTKCAKLGRRSTYRGRAVVCRRVSGTSTYRWK